MTNQLIRRLFGGAIMAVALMAAALFLAGGGVASAQTSCYPTCPTTPVPSPLVSQKPAAPAPVRKTTTALAFTGSDVAASVIISVVLIAGGLVLVRASRRRRTA